MNLFIIKTTGLNADNFDPVRMLVTRLAYLLIHTCRLPEPMYLQLFSDVSQSVTAVRHGGRNSLPPLYLALPV